VTQILPHLPYILAATKELPRMWGRFDHHGPADGTNHLLIVVGMAALAALVLMIWLRISRRPQRYFVSNSAPRLFRDLCSAHGLTHSDRRLLKRLAAARGLASPAFVFVEPKLFDEPPASLQSSAAELAHLRARLFG
jgi:hypothetical protein